MFDLRCSSRVPSDIKKLKKENVRLPVKLWEIIFSTLETPEKGLGKPEPLKGDLSGCWSRRINEKHRMVYRILEVEKTIDLISCYGHYD
ncbi:MAG: Txe/YoeB family addiction module toxin [Bacteroidota bacterium]